jgi:hypothetical protein
MRSNMRWSMQGIFRRNMRSRMRISTRGGMCGNVCGSMRRPTCAGNVHGNVRVFLDLCFANLVSGTYVSPANLLSATYISPTNYIEPQLLS